MLMEMTAVRSAEMEIESHRSEHVERYKLCQNEVQGTDIPYEKDCSR